MTPPPVPRLNLAPKLRRPLSLWNIKDYLRLLCWVFFFPQALRWYVDNFGGGNISEKAMNWGKGWELLRQNPIQRQLLLQGLILTVVTPVAVGLILQALDFWIDWFFVVFLLASGVVFCVAGVATRGVALSVTLGVALGVAWGVAFGVAFGVSRGVTLDVGGGVTLAVALGVVGGVAGGVALGVAFGVTLGVTLGVAGGVVFNEAVGVAGTVTLLVALSVPFNVALNVAFNVANVALVLAGGVAVAVALAVAGNVAFGVALGVAGGVSIMRPENWLIGLLFNQGSIQSSYLLPRITPIPLLNLNHRLQTWLQQDWEAGLHNTNEFLAYTMQFIPVVQAVNQVLATTPSEQIIWRVSRLAANPFDWNLVYFASASLREQIKSTFIRGILFFRYFNQSSYVLRVDTRLNTPARAAAAGFWHLHEKKPEKAMAPFAVVRHLLYGEEMYILTQTLAAFHQAKNPDTIATLQLPTLPQENLLRPETGKAIASLCRAVEDVQFVNRSVSRSAKSLALNRALGELTNVLNQADNLPQAEQGLIVDIAQTWKESLLHIAAHITFLQPVATRIILANPDEDFLLDYTPETLDEIYSLTYGQPYLVQLIGFELVSRYNKLVFEQGRSLDPVFTMADVEAVINNPEFFTQGSAYFHGVWGQAAQGAAGQHDILQQLAPHPQGLSLDALAEYTNMDTNALNEALATLKRHDVVEEREGRWRVLVELFRRWVLHCHPPIRDIMSE